MKVGVVFPWRSGDSRRESNFDYIRSLYRHHFPKWQLMVGLCDPTLPFNRSECIVDGTLALDDDTDIVVVADADVWCPPYKAVEAAAEVGWAVPHQYVIRLTAHGTSRYMDGNRTELHFEEKHVGHAGGTLLAIQRDLLLDVPPDVRFVGWGQEDDAWRHALNCLHGPCWRGEANLYHLWHPPQERMTRGKGNEDGVALEKRYRAARNKPDVMRELVAEGKALWPEKWINR